MRVLLILMLAVAPLLAAEEGGHAEPNIWWKWANFGLLAGVLYVIGSKYAGPFFKSRNEEIQSGLREARKLREDSEARVRDIDKRVSNLQSEMNAMREAAKKEMAAEAARIQAETVRAISKVQENAQNEIRFTAKHASQELKAFSAQLAVQLAGGQIRERLDTSTQDKLVQGFVSQLASVQKAGH